MDLSHKVSALLQREILIEKDKYFQLYGETL